MTTHRPFVIVGAGLAGGRAAQTLREDGYDGPVVLIGEETEPPYERPPLSKGLLLGTTEPEDVYLHQAGWYGQHDIDLRTGTRVTALDPASHRLELDGGEHVDYDRLLLATGSRPRTLPVPGADLDGVLSLRNLAHSYRIGTALTEDAHVVVVGAGWIGLEVAAAARARGAAVTVVETAAAPLRHVLGDEIAAVFTDLHRDHGVRFRFGAQVRRLLGTGLVSAVELADESVLTADVVIVGIGAQPNTELAADAGLAVDNGVLVDDGLCTADPAIWAAGDIANAHHPLLGTRVRVEHWAHALHSGPAAARAMLGQAVSYDRLPYFYTDQYDLGMEYTGHAPPGSYDRVVVRGDTAKRQFIAFWIAGRRVLAGMNVNIWDVNEPIEQLIRDGHPVDLGELADPDVPLDNVTRAHS
jgi:3-phenylpropionate/trans-cinnamate dioxygenase ferredoxin reductase subunit